MKTVLITGAAKRGGAAIARRVHARGYDVILHCRSTSLAAASAISSELNACRHESALVWQAPLDGDIPMPPHVDSLVGLVANASSYVDSNIDTFEGQLDADMLSHVIGHLRLINRCKDALTANCGAIVAITDIHVERATKGYLTYQISKGALASAVRALAVDLAPYVRVNAVAPGPLEWPCVRETSEDRKSHILQTTPLGRTGTFDELAKAVEFLLFDATFTTGSTLNVDGGRSAYLE
jgi:pteridine reductase